MAANAIASLATSWFAKPSTKPGFSVLNRPPPNYAGHVPLNSVERAALALGSAVIGLANPRRGDLIAVLGETTATPYFLPRLRDRMLSHPIGRRILRERPRITSSTLDVERLRELPSNTLGAAYARWLSENKVSPDTRAGVRYIDNEEQAYVMQRYRESHDFYHVITGMPVWLEGEIAVKAFEWANLGLPMQALSCGAVMKLDRSARERFWRVYGPWAWRVGREAECLMNVFWEEELDGDLADLRRKLRVEKPPDLREIRRSERRRREEAVESKEEAPVD